MAAWSPIWHALRLTTTIMTNVCASHLKHVKKKSVFLTLHMRKSAADAAEALRAEGNALYGKGKVNAAIERYTEAISLVGVGTVPALHVNRAMANKKRDTPAWGLVLEDALVVLKSPAGAGNIKALYLAGLAHAELNSNSYDDSISYLTKALEAARKSEDSIKDDIWKTLARVKHAQWRDQARCRAEELQMVRAKLAQSNLAADKEFMASMTRILGEYEARDEPKEVPSAFTCPLTLTVYRDPVLTKDSITYDRSILLQYIQKKNFDPITRKPLTQNDVFPNVALRSAVLLYLEEHPYAWKECY